MHGTALVSTSGILPPHDDSLKVAEEEWTQQLKILEKVDRWEKFGNENIPSKFSSELRKVLAGFSGLDRVPILKLLDHLRWNVKKLEKFFCIVRKVPLSAILQVVKLMDSFQNEILLDLILDLLFRFNECYIVEAITKLSETDLHFLIQVCRHLSAADILVMVDIIESLSLCEFIDVLRQCNEPMAKICRLCRAKRLHALEFRMQHGQVPSGSIPVAGMVAHYGKSEVWSADDEKGFSFEVSDVGGTIYWRKQPVDLVQVCDSCLLDVHQSITSAGRFDQVFSIVAANRKEVISALRAKEDSLGEIIWKVAHERKHRRAREFALRSLEVQRLGMKAEHLASEKVATEERRTEEARSRQMLRVELVSSALVTEDKWCSAGAAHEQKRLDRRMNYSEVRAHAGFSDARPAPRTRQHPHSWHLSVLDEDGVPVTEEGAAMLFGQHHDLPHDELSLIGAWKQQAEQKSVEYRQRQDEMAAALREKELRNFVALKDYVNERSKAFRRRQLQMEHLAEQEECDRVQQRLNEREHKKAVRFAKFMEYERHLMRCEDERSYRLRFFEWESAQIAREREDMFLTEVEQCETGDRFWGLDLFEHKLNAEEERLRRAYRDKVLDMNRKMHLMGISTPLWGGDRDRAPTNTKVIVRKPRFEASAMMVGAVSDAPKGSTREGRHAVDRARCLEPADAQLELLRSLKAEEIRGKLRHRLPVGKS